MLTHARSRQAQPVLRRQPHPARRVVRGPGRQVHDAARPQWRGQDDAAALPHGPARRSRTGRDPLSRSSDIATLPPYARASLGIGYVPQGRDIFPRLTVPENLEMGLATQKRGAGVPGFIFEMFPVLKDMLGRRGGDLSGGQQQQLAIGRALTLRPEAPDPRRADRGHPAVDHQGHRARDPQADAAAARWRSCWSSSTTTSPSRSPTTTS